jgi:hypothetical protein
MSEAFLCDVETRFDDRRRYGRDHGATLEQP